MAQMETVGHVVSRHAANRVDTKRLAAELAALGCSLNFLPSQSRRGFYLIWADTTWETTPETRKQAVAAVVRQAERLKIKLE